MYSTIISGAIVAGLVPFPISVRNTPVAVAELLMKTSSHRLLVTYAALKSLIDETKARLSASSYEVQIEEIPSLVVAYPQLAHETVGYPFEPYPTLSHRPTAMDTCMIIHSSGSTGIPKPIPQTHLYWIQIAAIPELREHIPRLVLGSMALPPFHAFGVGYQIIHPAYNVLACAVFPPTSAVSGGSPVVPSPNIVLEHAKATGTNAIFTIPAFIQAWSNSSDAIDYLKTLEFVSYAGGPLPPKLGNNLAASGVQLYPFYGGTEFGGPTCILRDKAEVMEWEYMRFYPHTKVSVGRLDDVIIHSSGEKTVPGPMEVIIMSNPCVQGAVVFGRERTQTGVLIELASGAEVNVGNEAQLALARNELWPTIEEANNVAPAFSKIFKEMILFAFKEKPLPRAGKGTVMRIAALNLYASEISALYDNIENNVAYNSRPRSWDIIDVENWILGQAIELTSRENIFLDVDLFDQGLDRQALIFAQKFMSVDSFLSLSATILRLRITHAMRSSGNLFAKVSQNLDQNLIYNMPTIKRLAAYLTSPPGLERAPQLLTETELIEELIAKYSINLGLLPLESAAPSAQNSDLVVLLTGSTGHLGSHILANLLKEDRITRIYAFNRDNQKSKSLLDRHGERFVDIGIDPRILKNEKLILITGDARRFDLGIEAELYREISLSVNVVIHNAWQIDFNLPLLSYEPNIQSSRYFVDLVRGGPNASCTRFLFISSVASAQSWDDTRGPVIEDLVAVSSALGGGYGEAKYIVERMLVNSGLQATSLRLGQICGGSPKGSWPTSEWFPLLVKSSVALGELPILGGVSLLNIIHVLPNQSCSKIAPWLPADSMAQAIIDIVLYPLSNSLPQVLNIVHPRPVEQRVIINGVISAVKNVLDLQLRTVSLDQWLSSIEAYADKATSDDLKTVPAIKLISFFRRSAAMSKAFSTNLTQSITTVLHPNRLKQIGDDDIKTWVEYWNGVGYFRE
ncbi:putative NRPS-like protein biosynthetic cluster [Termitomyces sp. Mn162]|nr:putative NRPS-like protein biosynthetic cluster [Termitomyces sp. Mn162]